MIDIFMGPKQYIQRMLYEALEGKTPFNSLEDVFNKPLPRPELALQKTDERSISYILKSLSKQPEERPHPAGQIIAGMQTADESRVKLKNHWIGRTFKDYKIENILPRGMVSISFQARDRRNGDPVVLKMFDASYSVGMADDDYRQSFEAEINALQKLEDGRRILKPRDHFSQEDLYFIVTDYKSGGNLRALLPHIQNRTLEIDDALKIFLQIAKSIDYVHEQNIIHRDIKPDNIVFSEEDGKIEIYLTDFGVAEVMATSQISFKTLDYTGTHRYMAPELWDAKAQQDKGHRHLCLWHPGL